MKVLKVFLDSKNKWQLNVEGTNNKGKKYTQIIAIPPTNGNRVDLITGNSLEEGYRYNIDGVIVINIISGEPQVTLFG